MKVDTSGLDVSIETICDVAVYLNLSNVDEHTNLSFVTDKQGLEHTAEQFISALFDYNEDLAHRLYQEFGNVADLKEEIKELKNELIETKELLYQAER